MKAVIVGEDPGGLAPALANRDVGVAHAAGTGDRSALQAAGIEEADVLVVTDAGLATAIPLAREHNQGIVVVAYTGHPLPPFVRGREVLGLDPGLLDPDAVAEAIVDRIGQA